MSNAPRPAAATADPRLGATIAYLRFPLRTDHRGELCDGSLCPHCGGCRSQKWGAFAGRQRFRCRDCLRTFSTFTGTPLRYLKRPEQWRGFLWCMEGRFTVRHTGAVLSIHKNTALRWRHRVLDAWRAQPCRRLRGSIAVGELWLPLNEKGSRRLRRAPRRQSDAPARTGQVAERVHVVMAIEADGDGRHECSFDRIRGSMLDQSDCTRLLLPRLGMVDEIVGRRGPLAPLAVFSRSVGAPYRMDLRMPRDTGLFRLRRELRRWMRPLYGVATHRLQNYLEWFRRDRPMPLPP